MPPNPADGVIMSMQQYYPAPIVRLIRSLSRLPSIGEKSAERLALHLLRAPREEALDLAEAIAQLKQRMRLCAVCFGLSDAETCPICANPARDTGVLCVVEQPGDMVSIEKSGAFRGRYHILQGALSPMDGIGPDGIRIRELMDRIQTGGIDEVILATGTSVEGEATADYIARQLAHLPVKVTRIAAGVPMGGDLKYVDQVTLRKALESRHAL